MGLLDFFSLLWTACCWDCVRGQFCSSNPDVFIIFIANILFFFNYFYNFFFFWFYKISGNFGKLDSRNWYEMSIYFSSNGVCIFLVPIKSPLIFGLELFFLTFHIKSFLVAVVSQIVPWSVQLCDFHNNCLWEISIWRKFLPLLVTIFKDLEF